MDVEEAAIEIILSSLFFGRGVGVEEPTSAVPVRAAASPAAYNCAFVPIRIARRFTVRGRVQGVGFRAFAERAALREGVVGWVGNREDGAVEALAEGEADAVAAFERALRAGPRGARVTQVSALDEPATGSHRTFRITVDPLREP
jgi:acylphosphatase